MALIRRTTSSAAMRLLLCLSPMATACGEARTCNGRAVDTEAAASGVPAPDSAFWAGAINAKAGGVAPIGSDQDLVANAAGGQQGAPTPEALVAVTGARVTLHKHALGKPFLLSPTLVLASNTPIIDHGQPLVVYFEQAQDRLALFAENHAAVYHGMPTRRLLQTFEVIETQADAYVFAWQFGLQSIDQRMPMAYSDWPASLSAYVEAETNVLPVSDAYLADAHMRGDTLVLHQVARVRRTLTPLDMWGVLQGGFETYPIDATVNVYFTLAPLRPNSAFVPKLSTKQRDIGYFEVATMRPGDGGLDAWATRWDTSAEAGPLTFKVTSDVPHDLRDAVREGIEYWNRVLGRELLQVCMDAAPDAMPEAREVVVHWIDWRKAGFARASVQPHPRTGEILRADVYLTSSFADVSAEHVVDAMVPEMPAAAQGPWQKALGVRWQPQGFMGAPQCAYASAASAVVRSTLDTHALSYARVRRAVADNIRLVVAHEVGHTLGLRHNFGASAQSSVPSQAAQKAIWQAYLGEATHPGAQTATSVMDYMDGADGFLLGAYIRDHALAYDQKAIAWGYDCDHASFQTATAAASGQQEAEKPKGDAKLDAPLLFCTDVERIDDLVGCAAHDSGRNPLDGHLAQAVASRQALPRWILKRFIDGLHPEYPGDAKTPQQIVEQFDFDKHSFAVAYWGQALFGALQDTTRVLQVQRAQGHLRALDPIAYKAATCAQLRTWLDEMGGLPGFLLTLLYAEPTDDKAPDMGVSLNVGWLDDAVRRLIAAPDFAHGHTADNRPYTLTDDEVTSITALAPKVASHLEQSVMRDAIATITGAAPGARDPDEAQTLGSVWLQVLAATAHIHAELVRPEWQDSLGGLARIVLMEQADEVIGQREGATVRVGAPRFREDVRLASVRLLSPVVFGTPSWLEALRTELTKQLKERLLRVANSESGPLGLRLAGLYTGPDFVIPVDVTPELRRWAETEMRILDALKKVQDNSVWRGVAESL